MRIFRDNSLRARVERRLALLRRSEQYYRWAADELRRCQPRSSAHVAGAVMLETRARALRTKIRPWHRQARRLRGEIPGCPVPRGASNDS